MYKHQLFANKDTAKDMTQTKLTLQIVNMTSLPDGGPLSMSVRPGEILEAGRDSGWCLPDPRRFISSRHFEVRYEKSGWVLYDLSTNGTFLNGAGARVKSPCPLNDRDRLQVGQYSLEVRLSAVAGDGATGTTTGNGGARRGPGLSPMQPDPPISHGFAGDAQSGGTPQSRPVARGLPGGSDPWAMGTTQGASIPPMGDQGTHQDHSHNASHEHTQTRPTDDIWAAVTGEKPHEPFTPPPEPGQSTSFTDTAGSPARPRQPAQQLPMQHTAQQPVSQTGAQPGTSPGKDAQALLAVIEAAAGLAPGTLNTGDPMASAQEIGQTLRVMTEELAGLLQARAVARRSVRSAQVTMIGREDNNPLKFMPLPDQALSIMFGAPRAGFLRGPQAVKSGFADIKAHQYATHAALQPALAQLLDDLSPEAIEKRLDGVRLNRKARAWDTYVERWDAKTRAHDNGMLDVFLSLFAEAYDKQGGRG